MTEKNNQDILFTGNVCMHQDGETVCVAGLGNGRLGFEDANDQGTGGTPLSISAGVFTDLPNDGLGAFSNSGFLPSNDGKEQYSLFDAASGKIDPRNLPLGSVIIVRVDFDVTPTVANSSIDFQFTLGDGAGAYTLPRSVSELIGSAGVPYQETFEASVYMGDTNTRDNLIGLQVRCSSDATVRNNGMAVYAFVRQGGASALPSA